MGSFADAIGGNNKRDGSGRASNDHYPTPPCATYALHVMEDLPTRLYEPAAGRGWMVNELVRCGHDVIASDIADYDNKLCNVVVKDFLATTSIDADAIVTNPPYMKDLPQKFVEHSLDLGYTYVAMLCKLTWAESAKRHKLFTQRPPTRVLVFSSRFNCDDTYFENDAAGQLGGMICYAWWIWDTRTEPLGKTEMKWIDTKAMHAAWVAETTEPSSIFV